MANTVPDANLSQPSRLCDYSLDSTKSPRAGAVGGEYCGRADSTVTIKHPGYPDELDQNILLRLWGFDRNGGGLHHGTALAACGIVAGNSWSGYFTETRDGRKLVLGDDDVLTQKEYYYYTGDEMRTVYPVYRSFEHWTFPHGQLPHPWNSVAVERDDKAGVVSASASNLTASVLRRDESCRLSQDMDYVEGAHLCPRSESIWFKANSMGRYNLNTMLHGDTAVDDVSNCIALRSDIHKAFDDGKFVMVPKEGKWVVQFLGLTSTLGKRFHNQVIHLSEGVSTQFIFARFAWTIFRGLNLFFDMDADREVLVKVHEKGRNTVIQKTMTVEELKSGAGGPRGRSVSPKKRKATNEIEEEQQDDEGGPFHKRLRYADSSPSIGPTVPSLGDGAASGSNAVGEASQEMQTDLTSDGSPPEMPTETSINVLEWIRKGRPTNPDIYCCNYTRAEADAIAGRPGNPEWGGARVCLRCRGVEYADDDDLAELIGGVRGEWVNELDSG